MRRITFIVALGDRLMQAAETNDLFEQESPAGWLYVKPREMGIIEVERGWMISEAGAKYIVDLVLPHAEGWLPVTLGEHPGPVGALRFPGEAESGAAPARSGRGWALSKLELGSRGVTSITRNLPQVQNVREVHLVFGDSIHQLHPACIGHQQARALI